MDILEDIKKMYPKIKIVPSDTQLGMHLGYKDRVMYLNDMELMYRNIGHSVIDGKQEITCEDCGHTHMEDKYKFIVDVPVEKLTEEQKKEQREAIINVIKSNLIRE